MKETRELTKDRFEEFVKSHAFTYCTAQHKLCFAIIKRMYARCIQGYYFKGVKVCVNKGIVVDGNHRYIAYLLAEIEFEIIDWRSSDSDVSKHYSKLDIDFEKDWDVNLYCNRKYISDGDWLDKFKRD